VVDELMETKTKNKINVFLTPTFYFILARQREGREKEREKYELRKKKLQRFN